MNHLLFTVYGIFYSSYNEPVEVQIFMKKKIVDDFSKRTEKYLQLMTNTTRHHTLVFKIEALMKFHFKGLANFNPSLEGLVQNQDLNPRIYK